MVFIHSLTAWQMAHSVRQRRSAPCQPQTRNAAHSTFSVVTGAVPDIRYDDTQLRASEGSVDNPANLVDHMK